MDEDLRCARSGRGSIGNVRIWYNMRMVQEKKIVVKAKEYVISFEGGRTIRDCIFTVRGVQVMVDWDLAALYGVETRVMNQPVKRNDKKPHSIRHPGMEPSGRGSVSSAERPHDGLGSELGDRYAYRI